MKWIMRAMWPAFITACMLELVVFAVVDPQDVHFGGRTQSLSPYAIYAALFFLFWVISTIGGVMTLVLARSADQINREQ